MKCPYGEKILAKNMPPVFYLRFFIKVAEYVKKYATEEALRGDQTGMSSEEESSMSDFSEDEAQDMEL